MTRHVKGVMMGQSDAELVRQAMGRFDERESSYRIAKALDVSPATVRRFKAWINEEDDAELAELQPQTRDALKRAIAGHKKGPPNGLTAEQKAQAFDAIASMVDALRASHVTGPAPATSPPASSEVERKEKSARAVRDRAKKNRPDQDQDRSSTAGSGG